MNVSKKDIRFFFFSKEKKKKNSSFHYEFRSSLHMKNPAHISL